MKTDVDKRLADRNTRPEEAVEILGAFEAKTHLSRVLRQASAGKHFVITHRGRAVAEIHPPKASRRRPKWGDMKNAVRMSEDFREPLPSLEGFFE
jgi:antitoxin (DNA-binding transcriptional repressor) of toxin-antitoxin stability system